LRFPLRHCWRLIGRKQRFYRPAQFVAPLAYEIQKLVSLRRPQKRSPDPHHLCHWRSTVIVRSISYVLGGSHLINGDFQ